MKRYQDVITQGLHPGPFHSFVEKDNGKWCLYSDVETLEKERDELRREVSDLRSGIEEHRAKLAACLIASNQNTRIARQQRIGPSNPYYSVAYASVCAAVGREIELREERDELRERLARFEEGKPPRCVLHAVGEDLDDSNETCLDWRDTGAWLKRIASIGEKEQEGEKGGKSE